jgi:hypothetical protein
LIRTDWGLTLPRLALSFTVPYDRLERRGATEGDPVIHNLILGLLAWLANRDRSYRETIDVWRTSCPRLPVWEEANDQGLVALEVVDGLQLVDSRRPVRNCLNKDRSGGLNQRFFRKRDRISKHQDRENSAAKITLEMTYGRPRD